MDKETLEALQGIVKETRLLIKEKWGKRKRLSKDEIWRKAVLLRDIVKVEKWLDRNFDFDDEVEIKDTADICEEAHNLTVKKCKKLGIEVDCSGCEDCDPKEETHYGKEAQDIFNDYFDEIENEQARYCVKCGRTSNLRIEEDICHSCAEERGR